MTSTGKRTGEGSPTSGVPHPSYRTSDKKDWIVDSVTDLISFGELSIKNFFI